MQPGKTVSRIESVDIFRLIAIVAVITIHTSPFRGDIAVENEAYKYLDVIFNQISRFAVPFFFIISGYFWGSKIRSGSDPISSSIYMSKRILIIFLSWCFIYLLPLNFSSIYEYGLLGPAKVAYWNIRNLAQEPVTLLLQGTKVHLWFLVGMLCALMVSTFFVITKNLRLLVVFSIFLYLFGVLAKSYANTPIGINIDFNTRNGPFFSTLLFVTGYLLSGKKINTKWAFYGCLVFCIGCVVHFVEIYTLWRVFETTPIQDYVIGTYFMGLGVAMAALSNHPILRNKIFSKIGQMTLGIYAVHFIFVDLLRPIDEVSDHILWEVGYVVAVLALSILISLALSKNKITRKIVV